MPTTSVDDTVLSFQDSGGSGLPVLFLHAFPLNSKMWESQIDALGERYRCIAPDLKGFGASDAPDDLSAYSIESYADEVHQLLANLALEAVVLVGLSMGGYIAFEFTRKYRGSLAALVLADTRADADAEEVKERRTNQQQKVRSEGPSALVDGLAGTLLAASTLESKDDVVDRAKALMDNPAAGYLGALEAMKRRRDSNDVLSSIAVPTLVVVGEEDGVTPPDAARRLHEQIAGSRFIVVPNAGHLSNLEAPDAFNGALAEFLADVEKQNSPNP